VRSIVAAFIAAALFPASAQDACIGATTAEQAQAQIEKVYAKNAAAFAARDADAVMKLRHPDFHTVDPAGRRSTRAQMDERTRGLIARVERFDRIRETIRSLELHGDIAIATVLQETSRSQRLQDGELHKVDTSATQREWWRCTGAGWLMWRVDEVAQGTLLVDGRPQP
jgi:ketosteroid isomerase-like protein